MKDFMITTENTADLPDKYVLENELGIMALTYMIDGNVYDKDNSLPYKEFYDRIRNGSMPTTSQINPETAREKFQSIVDKGMDVLHISFSSGLSGSYNSARIAAEEMKEENPDARIIVVDSLCASLGQGLIVHKAVEMKKAGKTLDEIVKWLEENKLHICHMVAVDDLNHLYRGGRVSKSAAFIGTMINVKPLIHVNDEGKLIPIAKVRGRKKSLTALVDSMEAQMGSCREQNDIVFISHADCLEDAEFVAAQIRDRFGIEKFIIDFIGPVIGSHTGPGTVAVFFMGEKR
ncbi:DegV family protein [Anaerobium acetethylicum]|uniref:EDD domain protein, DegV family n=1 Tax=Anaerobium acetethylicum TaxID=1619234 RepID=A0A1D3TVD0_9FIRM|nr:DegV family protein [Anaerobium acetethylicum]SCP98089.1 EDD domain protein, DegV family [Anaerobium acetethylicum]